MVFAPSSRRAVAGVVLLAAVGGLLAPHPPAWAATTSRDAEQPAGAGPAPGALVRVNDLGYLPDGPKRATVVTPAMTPLRWTLRDRDGDVVATGTTRVHGRDAMAGQHVHVADFSAVDRPGHDYRLVVGGAASPAFDIDARLYDGLRRDALAYFYHNRSGVPIESRYVGRPYARPAGHLGVPPNRGDLDVACAPRACTGRHDVRGGWYDAGDQGKYVVNGGLAAWQLLDLYERAAASGHQAEVADGTTHIPESGNGVPDVLDEARFEIEFLLRMQVPDGQPLAGMAYHKVNDARWTGLPMRPADDPQPRLLYPPTTAATLNLAAVAARAARVFRHWDPGFAERCRIAAEQAWAAARAHPHRLAPEQGAAAVGGGGAYADPDVSDEFSWAAAELFATTGRHGYLRHVRFPRRVDFSWQSTAALGELTLARSPRGLPARQRALVRRHIVATADASLAAMARQGYANPYLPADGRYVWGSNSVTANHAIVLATAYDLTGARRYRDGAIEAADYLLGRNALGRSYVTGYGEHASHRVHHRFWAHELDHRLPPPPPGVLVGGPNSGMDDPVVRSKAAGCAPAACYVDDIESFSTNEVAINWNAPLAWLAAFLAAPDHG